MNRTLTKIALVSASIIGGPLLAFAWTSAPSNPPSNNVSAPINVSGTAQSKAAGLLLNTGGATNGLLVQYGKVGIGTLTPGYKLQVGEAGDGSSVGSNAFFYISDVNQKKNIATLKNSLENVLKLRGVSFNWKTTNEKSVGLIAQEVEKVYPELVMTNASTSVKSVQYANLVGPLIEAVKAQQAEIEALKARVAKLEAGKK